MCKRDPSVEPLIHRIILEWVLNHLLNRHLWWHKINYLCVRMCMIKQKQSERSIQENLLFSCSSPFFPCFSLCSNTFSLPVLGHSAGIQYQNCRVLNFENRNLLPSNGSFRYGGHTCVYVGSMWDCLYLWAWIEGLNDTWWNKPWKTGRGWGDQSRIIGHELGSSVVSRKKPNFRKIFSFLIFFLSGVMYNRWPISLAESVWSINLDNQIRELLD